ncbi:MAG: hypothetical protein KBG48_25640 [Kofleriaceae bacterium]|nr:hypothetical protein [Kofleriaceae bacterium]MBP9170806.1 hypothetical protein [Kofleriaceae bacterium]MBP9857679.1 hypothetical protein [Kofleriaceae bacterium]
MKAALRAAALALVGLAAACGDDGTPAGEDGRPPDAPMAIDAGIDAPPDANTFTTFVIDQIQNQTTATASPVPFATFGTLPDPDVDNPAAYAPLFP